MIIENLAYDLETIFGIPGGKRVQYARAIGGFNYMTFGERIEVVRTEIVPETVAEMEDQLALVSTGKPRLSGSIHVHVWGAYHAGVPGIVKGLYSLRNVAIRMRTTIENGTWTCLPSC